MENHEKKKIDKKSDTAGDCLPSSFAGTGQDVTIDNNRLNKIEYSLTGPLSVFSELFLSETLYTVSCSLPYMSLLLLLKVELYSHLDSHFLYLWSRKFQGHKKKARVWK